jgi:type IV pilus assembly protein PilY1
MRSGGRGLFALDVTNPANFGEANAASIVKWEFTDANDTALGYTYAQPAIVKMRNGKWAAILGNGYNSNNEQAALFIIFLEGPGAGTWTSGTHYIKIPVGNTGQGNGLSTAAPVDIDGDGLIDYVYAGDLQGKMWQFNVTSATPGNWTVAYGGAPLFSTPSGQPITAQPEVGFNLLTDDEDDLVVYFGTGRYIEASDSSQTGQATQSFYGIFADPIQNGSPFTERTTSPSPARSDLLQQTIVAEATTNGISVRVTSDNLLNLDPSVGTVHKGWYIDLAYPSGTNNGERQVSRPTLRNGRVIDRKSTRLNSSHNPASRMPSSA